MNRITAKAILGELLEAYDECEHGDYFYDNGDVVCDAVECILEEPRWISVEEQLPEKITNKVLVYCKNGYIGFGHYEKFQGVEDWYNLESGKPFREWDLEDCETYEVTHWMPLPEPPEVEG